MSSHHAETSSIRVSSTSPAGPAHKIMVLSILYLFLSLPASALFFAREEETFYPSFKVDSSIRQKKYAQNITLSKVPGVNHPRARPVLRPCQHFSKARATPVLARA